jgi:tRNA A37 threonylcarbamoyladenosine modification protein TsaB
VYGLPSAAALAQEGEEVAVVGDARRGKFWVALFEDMKLRGGVFQVERAALANAVGGSFSVVSPDDARIGAKLREIFAERYLGLRVGDGEGLEIYAEANAEELVAEPLPIYLNPAVRAD